MSMIMNNKLAKIRAYKKEAAEAKARRAEELENGAPLNRYELEAKRDKEILAMEEKYGIDDSKTREAFPIASTGSTAANAWAPNGTLRTLYSDGTLREGF